MGTIVGSGEYRYELVSSWPQMLRYWSFEKASDAAVNSHGEIHVLSRGAHPVTIWDTSGNLISSWGEGMFSNNGPHGIYIAPNDHVWIADINYHVVIEFTPGGEPVRELGKRLQPSPRWDGRPFNMPTGISISREGDVFVSDGYGSNRVHKFSSDGELLLSWGEPGAGPGEFALLHNVGVDSRGRVFICDRENDRIQLFDQDGNYLEQWTDFTGPGDIWFHDDIVYVVEQFGGCGVSIWTLEGDPVTRWRGDEGPGKGTLSSSHGICVDAEGSIYVTEMNPGRVQKFQRL